MKLIKKHQILIIILLAVILFGGGLYLYKGKQQKNSEQEASQGKVGLNEESESTVENGNGVVETPKETPVETKNTAIADLKDVSLTVYLVTEETVSSDGKTKIPVGSISPYFYLPAGTYTVQKLSGKTWIDVASSIKYNGHGGLAVATIIPAEDNVGYRIQKLEGGKVVAVSKIFVVKRTDVTDGVHTYN